MATITFNAGEDTAIANLSGSGIGFYGSGGFGYSVPVGDYPYRTFVTNSAGTVEGSECDNVRYVSSTGCVIGQTGTPILLTQVPNYLSTLNIRFSHTSAVTVNNAAVRIYDRSGINNNPSGVTCYAAEIIHTGVTQVASGLGDASWAHIRGSTNILSLQNSPGESGLTPGSSGQIHDWYIILSPSPDSIGSKGFAAYFACEFL